MQTAAVKDQRLLWLPSALWAHSSRLSDWINIECSLMTHQCVCSSLQDCQELDKYYLFSFFVVIAVSHLFSQMNIHTVSESRLTRSLDASKCRVNDEAAEGVKRFLCCHVCQRAHECNITAVSPGLRRSYFMLLHDLVKILLHSNKSHKIFCFFVSIFIKYC